MFDDHVSRLSLASLSIKDRVYLCIAFAGLLISSSGFIVLWQQINRVAAAPPLTSSEETSAAPQVAIDIGGAVKNPGILFITPGERVAKVIELAGGFTETADPYFIAHSLNLAQSLSDEQKIYIPFIDEQPREEESEKQNPEIGQLVSINTASLSELDTLEGVGEKRAEAILAGRPYTALNELVSKKVISESLFSLIESKIKL